MHIVLITHPISTFGQPIKVKAATNIVIANVFYVSPSHVFLNYSLGSELLAVVYPPINTT